MQEWQLESLRVRRYASRAEMGKAAGEYAAELARELLAKRETITILFAAAPSQNEMLEAFMASDLDFTRIHALHMDEYIGLPKGAPQRFARYLDVHAFSLKAFASVQYLSEGDEDGETVCSRYEEILARHPLDIAFIGLGENGHIAFNDPHEADFEDPKRVKVVTLDGRCRQQQVNDGCFAALNDVPRYAVTLTIPAIMAAPRLVCTVPAAAKAEAVTHSAYAPISTACPGTILRRHAGCVLFCDEQSGAGLKIEGRKIK